MSTKNSEVRILGRYIPSEFCSHVIEREFKSYLSACCRCEWVDIRIPQGIEPHPDNLEWHQDGGGPEGVTRHMVVWASEMPTEIRLSSGEEFHSEPFDVVWFDNYLAFHKQPRDTRPRERWFAAVRCSGAVR